MFSGRAYTNPDFYRKMANSQALELAVLRCV